MILEKTMTAEEILKQLIEGGLCSEIASFTNECMLAIEAFTFCRDSDTSPKDMLSLLRRYSEGTKDSGTPIMLCEAANAISLLLNEVPARMLLESPPKIFIPFVHKTAADDIANTLERLEDME